MKVTHTGSIYCQPTHGGKFEYEFWPINGEGGGFEHLGTFVRLHEFEIDDEFDPRHLLIARLEADKQKAAAEYQKRVTELNAKIQSLLAIEA